MAIIYDVISMYVLLDRFLTLPLLDGESPDGYLRHLRPRARPPCRARRLHTHGRISRSSNRQPRTSSGSRWARARQAYLHAVVGEHSGGVELCARAAMGSRSGDGARVYRHASLAANPIHSYSARPGANPVRS